MIAENFYPIFTLTITILACLYEKKTKIVPGFHQGISLGLLEGGLAASPDPQLQSFLALPKTDAPIFFLHYPLIKDNFGGVFLSRKKVTNNFSKLFPGNKTCQQYLKN